MGKKIKQIGLALVVVVIVAGAIGAVKAAQIGAMIEAGEAFVPPPIGVTTAEVDTAEWESLTAAIGTAEAVQGVMVASEVPGTVTDLRFDSGDMVERGQVLATLDASTERAQLASARAQLELAEATLRRSSTLAASRAMAQAELEQAQAQEAQARAQIAGLRATIAKKTIRAPFAGRLGIRQANLGEILQPGSPIVSLQSTGPIFVDFNVPEQALPTLQVGMTVRATSDTYPGEPFEGTIETIDTAIDRATRNVRVRAIFPDERERMRPGMFLQVQVVQPDRREVLAVPNTAVLYAPYGDSVYVVEDDENGGLVAKQSFVRLGERRGDFVEVLEGLESGQTVVSTGAFKLSNGAAVTIENDVSPGDPSLEPEPENR